MTKEESIVKIVLAMFISINLISTNKTAREISIIIAILLAIYLASYIRYDKDI